MSDIDGAGLIELTAELVSAYVMNNDVAVADLPGLVTSIHQTLASLGEVEAVPSQLQQKQGAVSVRRSLADPARIVSMIDGKSYSSLKRHIGKHGYTPEKYRQMFGLPASYPMVAPGYSARRSALAMALGLGRKRTAPAAAPAVPQAKGSKTALAAAKSHLTGSGDTPARGRGGRTRAAKFDGTSELADV